MKSSRVLKQQNTELARLGQGQDAGAKFVELGFARSLPSLIRFFPRNFHGVREFLPYFYGEGEVIWRLLRPSLRHGWRRGSVKRVVDLAGIENLGVIAKLVKLSGLFLWVKSAIPAFGRRARVGIARRSDLDVPGGIKQDRHRQLLRAGLVRNRDELQTA